MRKGLGDSYLGEKIGDNEHSILGTRAQCRERDWWPDSVYRASVGGLKGAYSGLCQGVQKGK